MEAIRAKEIQVKKMQAELIRLKFEALLGQCFIRTKRTGRYEETVPIYIQITKLYTGSMHDNTRVDYIQINEHDGAKLTMRYFTYESIYGIQKDNKPIEENVFIDKVQKLMHKIPLLKQVQDRKRLEPSE